MSKYEKPRDLFLFEGISCISFNKNFTKVALSKKDNIIYIYSIRDLMKTDTWQLEYQLQVHEDSISGLDWNAHTNLLLSCSYDKNAFVWEYNRNYIKNWNGSGVIATTKLGYLCCKWNNRGDKFCLGTSGKQIFIGYFDNKTNWWMCKPLGKIENKFIVHKSSVVCCEIDPTSLFVLSGSTDLRVCVTSCYLPEIDDKFLDDKTKPLAREFGTIIYAFRPGSWINTIAWNKSGSLGFAAAQNSSIVVINHKENKTDVIKCNHPPVTLIVSNEDNSFLAVCYDRNILEYEKKGDKWEIKKTITNDQGKKGDVREKINKLQSFEKLKQKTKLLVTTKKNPHLHQSLISSLNIKGKDIITTDIGGFVKYWKL
jgi:actin related protein 2/3 complex subunit 1A/1B